MRKCSPGQPDPTGENHEPSSRLQLDKQSAPVPMNSTLRFSWQNQRNWFFLGFLAASVLLFWQPISTLWRVCSTSDEYTHILLVLPISMSLAYLEGRNLKLQPRYAVLAGSVLLFLSLALRYLVMNRLGAEDGEAGMVFLLVLFWTGSILACYGPQVFRTLIFPILFLFLLVPVPIAWLDRAIGFLQQASTSATFLLFKLSGIPVMKDGFILSLPRLQIEVAKQCSGIRSSEMLLITGLTLAHLSLRSFWGKLAFVALIVPLSVAKNAVRIFTLSTLAIYVDPGFLAGPLHTRGGIVFFALAVAAMLLALRLLQRMENRRSPTLLPSSPG